MQVITFQILKFSSSKIDILSHVCLLFTCIDAYLCFSLTYYVFLCLGYNISVHFVIEKIKGFQESYDSYSYTIDLSHAPPLPLKLRRQATQQLYVENRTDEMFLMSLRVRYRFFQYFVHSFTLNFV